MNNRVWMLLLTILTCSCATNRQREIATYGELARACGLSRAGLDSLMLESAQRVRLSRGIEISVPEFTAILATTINPEAPPRCRQQAAYIVQTVMR